jgi:hypothetical protein
VTDKYAAARSRQGRLSAEYACIDKIIVVSGDSTMAISSWPPDRRQQRKTTPGLEIFANVDEEQLRPWFRSVLLATLVEPRFFEGMGFPSSFVRQFLRKHRKVLLFGGTVARGVRGINELEFLRGLAEVLGVRPFTNPWDPHDTMTTTAVARQCLAAWAALEDGRGTDALPAPGPDARAEIIPSGAGA